MALHDTNSIITFSDHTTVIALITNNDESDYREETSELALWCRDNNLSLNISKTKEFIVDLRKQRREYSDPHQRDCSRASQHF